MKFSYTTTRPSTRGFQLQFTEDAPDGDAPAGPRQDSSERAGGHQTHPAVTATPVAETAAGHDTATTALLTWDVPQHDLAWQKPQHYGGWGTLLLL